MMAAFPAHDLLSILPALWLAIAGMALLMTGGLHLQKRVPTLSTGEQWHPW